MDETESPETFIAKDIDLKLSAFMDESHWQFDLVLDLLCGNPAHRSDEILAHLEAEPNKGRGLL